MIFHFSTIDRSVSLPGSRDSVAYRVGKGEYKANGDTIQEQIHLGDRPAPEY